MARNEEAVCPCVSPVAALIAVSATGARRIGVRLGGFGSTLFIAALFALLIGAGYGPFPESDPIGLQFAPGDICHAGSPEDPPPSPGDHHGLTCPFCPICVFHAQVVIALPPPASPVLQSAALTQAILPWAPAPTGPPPSPTPVPESRAPPFPI